MMDNLSNMYYLLRFIVARIFVYLRDVILHEFSWFAEEIDDLDPTVMKTRANPFTKRALADFVAFVTICVCFGTFVILSAKCAKDEETRYNPPPRPASPVSEGEPVELLEDEEEEITILNSELEDRTRNPWGDAITVDTNLNSLTRRKIGSHNRSRACCSSKNRQLNFELRGSHSQHSQSTQTSERILQRASKNRDWLIRRTRSGHIYGKYPM